MSQYLSLGILISVGVAKSHKGRSLVDGVFITYSGVCDSPRFSRFVLISPTLENTQSFYVEQILLM